MSILRERMMQEMRLQNYSENTIKTYTSLLGQLAKHYQKCPSTITISEFKTYLNDQVLDRGLSNSTINQLINGFKFLKVQILEQEWDDFKVKRPKKNKKLPSVISREEAIKVVTQPKNIKHRVILMLGYSAGLRISEVIQLKVSDIDSNRMQIKICDSKGRKDRYTILSERMLKELRNYYRLYRPEHWLIEGMGSTPLFLKQYSPGSIHKILKRSSQAVGLKKKITYHTLRHSFATHLLEAGTDILTIKNLLGHSHVATTYTYLHISNKALQSVNSPLDKSEV